MSCDIARVLRDEFFDTIISRQPTDDLGVIMEMEVEFHDEREFERWLRRAGGVTTGRVAGKLALVALHGGARVGMPAVRSLGGDLHEIRVGMWRVYFTQRGHRLIVLCGGTKDSQSLDIARARRRLR